MLKVDIFLIVLGLGCLWEAIGYFRHTSAGQRAAVGSLIVSTAAAYNAKRGNKLAAGLLGGFGGSLLGIFYPIIGFIMGLALFSVGIVGVVKGDTWESKTPAIAPQEPLHSMCGDTEHYPSNHSFIGLWSEYRCKTKEAAGSDWTYCLPRKRYSKVAGQGCEDDKLCCPATGVVSPESYEKAKKTKQKRSSGAAANREPKIEEPAVEQPVIEEPYQPYQAEPGNPVDEYLKTGGP